MEGIELVRFVTDSETKTQAFAAHLAQQLPVATVVTLHGTLGAGKTRFAQGFAQGLGIPVEQVVSPTFVLHQIYLGRCRLHHFDVYRLSGPEAFWELAEDYVPAADGLTLIEWAEKVAPCLPVRYLAVTLRLVSETTREVTVTGFGGAWPELQSQLQSYLGSNR